MSNEIEIDMTVPTASNVMEQEQEQEQEQMTLVQMKEFLPHLEVADLLELQDIVNTLLKKKWKSTSSAKGSKAKASQLDKPKKPASKALLRTQSWIAYVLRHSTENGWEPFHIRQETKNKATGEKEVEVTERSGSKPNSSEEDEKFQPYTYKNKETGEIITPAHVFEDTGKHLTYKDAMTLIAILKWKEGVKPATKFASEEEEKEHWSDLYVQFMDHYTSAQPVLPESEEESDASSTPSSPKVVRLTAAEKEEERAHKRQIAEEEKERKRQAKEEEKREREEKKAKEQEEKDAKKAQKTKEREEKLAKEAKEKEEKEAKKAREKEEKEQGKKKSPIPSAAIIKKSPTAPSKPALVPSSSSSSSSSSSTTKTLTPAKTTAPPVSAPAKPPAPAKPLAPPVSAPVSAPAKPAPKQLKKKEEEKIVWNIPEDKMAHEWTFQGKTYLVNSEKGVWEKEMDGTPGKWLGMVVLEENRIDDSIPEPEYYDVEEEEDNQ